GELVPHGTRVAAGIARVASLEARAPRRRKLDPARLERLARAAGLRPAHAQSAVHAGFALARVAEPAHEVMRLGELGEHTLGRDRERGFELERTAAHAWPVTVRTCEPDAAARRNSSARRSSRPAPSCAETCSASGYSTRRIVNASSESRSVLLNSISRG